MFRKSIIAFAAAATLGLAALASGPAEARGHFGGHMHMGGFHHMGAFHMRAFPRFAVRHRIFVRRFAVIRAPILIGPSCWRIRWVHVHHHWRRHRVWVCG